MSQRIHSLIISAVLAMISLPATTQQLMLEEVLVTAQKREQSLQDVPLTVNVVSAEFLAQANLNSIADVQQLVPALNIYSATGPALTSVIIRGAGTGAAGPTLEPSVGIFVDGVFMPRSIFGLTDLVNVERVEVLMGPQGTLYGKNTNAGVISVVTRGAPEGFEAQLEGSMGDYDLAEGKISLANTINDAWSWRFGALVRQRDGLFEDEISGDDDLNEVDRQSYRAQLYYDSSEQLRLRAIGYYSLDDANQGNYERLFDTDSAWWNYFDGVQSSQGLPSPGLDGEDRKVQTTEPSQSEVEVAGGSLQLDYDFNDSLSLTSITALQNWSIGDVYTENDGLATDFLYGSVGGEEDVFSQELRLSSSNSGPLNWMAGLYYFNSSLEAGDSQKEFVYNFGFPGLDVSLGPLTLPLAAPGDYSHYEYEIDTESWSAFTQTTWAITDATDLTLGLRYEDESKDMSMLVAGFDASDTPWSLDNALTGAYQGGFFVPLTSGNLDDDGPTLRADDRSEDNWSGMVSLKHQFDSTMLYATVSTGSKSGGYNVTFGGASVEEREFDTEDTINYEIGAKMEGLWDGRARVNVALFYTEYDDFQAATFDPVTVELLVKNAGQQTTQGVDIEAQLLLTENLSARLALEYLDAEYDDFQGANCHPLADATVVDGTCILDGETLEFAPEWSGSMSAAYRLPLQGDREFYSWLGYEFKSDYLADATRAPYAEDIDFGVWNGSLGWRSSHWDISLWGKNLTDETYVTTTVADLFGIAFANPILIGDVNSSLNHARWLNEPRTWGVTLRYTH